MFFEVSQEGLHGKRFLKIACDTHPLRPIVCDSEKNRFDFVCVQVTFLIWKDGVSYKRPIRIGQSRKLFVLWSCFGVMPVRNWKHVDTFLHGVDRWGSLRVKMSLFWKRFILKRYPVFGHQTNWFCEMNYNIIWNQITTNYSKFCSVWSFVAKKGVVALHEPTASPSQPRVTSQPRVHHESSQFFFCSKKII